MGVVVTRWKEIVNAPDMFRALEIVRNRYRTLGQMYYMAVTDTIIEGICYEVTVAKWASLATG